MIQIINKVLENDRQRNKILENQNESHENIKLSIIDNDKIPERKHSKKDPVLEKMVQAKEERQAELEFSLEQKLLRKIEETETTHCVFFVLL